MFKLDKLSNVDISRVLDPNLVLGASAMGFGNAIQLLLMPPFVLLFSYTRKPRFPILDMLIPVAGIALILFVYLEGIHQLLPLLPVGKVNLQELKQAITDSFSLMTTM
jgi:hypothetical protein